MTDATGGKEDPPLDYPRTAAIWAELTASSERTPEDVRHDARRGAMEGAVENIAAPPATKSERSFMKRAAQKAMMEAIDAQALHGQLRNIFIGAWWSVVSELDHAGRKGVRS